MRLKEKDILLKLTELYSNAKPVSLRIFPRSSLVDTETKSDVKGLIKVENQKTFDVNFKVVSVATPNNLRTKAIVAQREKSKIKKSALLLFVASYIGGKQMDILKELKISWMDLCGNMRIEIPGEVFIEKTGSKNKYPDSVPIKKIFQGTSSLVSRALLLKPEGFKSQYEITDFINSCNGKITKATVSRVIKKLYDELLVEKLRSAIKVKDADALLDNLEKNYTLYSKIKSKYRYLIDNEQKFFATIRPSAEYAVCGFYAAKLKDLAITEQITIVVKNLDEFKQNIERYYNWQLEPDFEYGNLTVIENDEPGVWFNLQRKKADNIVDDIELYLELMNDKPRGPKIAEQLKENILGKFKNE